MDRFSFLNGGNKLRDGGNNSSLENVILDIEHYFTCFNSEKEFLTYFCNSV